MGFLNLAACPTCWERDCRCLRPAHGFGDSGDQLRISELEKQLAQSRKETRVLMDAIVAAGFQPELTNGVRFKLVPISK